MRRQIMQRLTSNLAFRIKGTLSTLKVQRICMFREKRDLRRDLARVESLSRSLKFPRFISIYPIVLQGKDLPAKDLSGTSDPYVRVTLLPDKKHRLETKIKRRTLNPRWNETFYFEGKRTYI